MTAAFVVDASIALTWAFADEATPKTLAMLDRLQDEGAVVPWLWFLELTNVLAIAERKGRVSEAQSAAFLENLGALAIEVDDELTDHALRKCISELLPLCRQHKLTSYDAVYLELAVRRSLPLATLDARCAA